VLYLAIITFCAIGSYAFRGNPNDVLIAATFGVVGYFFIAYRCEPAPLLLGFVLGPAMEAHLRHALSLSEGDWGMFVARPVSAGLLISAAAMVLLGALPAMRRRRDRTFEEHDSSI
jgi:TctA family transporter